MKLTGWLRGGSDELGWDDLIRRIVEAVSALARHAERGRIAFPAEVAVRIAVGEGSVDLIRQFVASPELDREVEKALSNRHDCDLAALPLRAYTVTVGGKTVVSAVEAEPRAWQLTIEGGDFSGRTLLLPPGRTELLFGRGEWHGADRHVRNDIAICEQTSFVSRRAGRLVRDGNQLEVAALDQGDSLTVKRPGGEVLRPARTAKGRVTVCAGDVIELEDGRGGSVRLVLRRAAREGEL